MENLALAWAAGFIDGEGCISIKRLKQKNRKKINYQLIIQVAQLNLKPLYKLKDIFGGTICKEKKTKKRPCFTWYCRGTKALHALDRLTPHLLLKKEEASIALEYRKFMIGSGRRLSEHQKDEIEILYKKLREIKVIIKEEHNEFLV